ncbi:mannose-6-phosphate isomerase, class I [Kribbella flavida DSM 17836]|uniref:mannose-6-phosphate isomerase n=1 Tax=Kribbella flavida (strain DSM 17836 / JCM 10339 / NBRC 14399) TaxID=479435 RepID=D2PMF3_KRIFD|nr:mannose-6-phosphate isomerase, class I [Kribbella flavida]ADB30697.1 mannose-6-phosphate isomerase, class I [Kribbella flavida DSM 17836]
MVARLRTAIRDYAWGSPTAIPELLGVEPDGSPQAELWMGAHESAPSVLPSGESLYDAVSARPAETLGAETAERFDGRFPFLAKILAAAQPLSIQAHPSPEQAVDGYRRDEQAGVPRDAADRNYKDSWPKPEILIALEPFDALVGFRPLDRTVALLDALAPTGLAELTDLLRDGKLQDAFAQFMSSDRDTIRPLVAALGEACRQYTGDAFAAEVETLDRLSTDFPDDPGVLAALLLNRVTLQRFEAVYLPAGNVHAYLRGTGFEVMANSDNVLRGGLTSKHIDVPELVSVVDFSPLADPVLRGTPAADGVTAYETGCPYFAVRRVHLAGDAVTVAADGPRIVAVVDGSVTVGADGTDETEALSAGQSAFLAGPEGPCTLRGSGTAFVVSAR